MIEKNMNLCPLKKSHLSRAFIRMGVLLLILMTGCSCNGTHMADKEGARKGTLGPIDAQAPREWTRIIVHFEVPDLAQLQSQAAKLKDPAAAKAMDKKIAQRIAEVADDVLKQLEPADVRLIRRYDTLPILALQVTPEAQTTLKSMPEVLRIETDALHSPGQLSR